jgi:radical SAM protein with 4Fe4S-binding SPASM domain
VPARLTEPIWTTYFRIHHRQVPASGKHRIFELSGRVPGNIHRTSLQDILRSDYLTQFVQTVPKPCAGCELFSGCRGGCRAAGQQLWNSLDQGDPVLRLR